MYEFRREYQAGEQLAPDEVRLNGKKQVIKRIEYGIENSLFRKARGENMNEHAKFAEVKVSASGDAIISYV